MNRLHGPLRAFAAALAFIWVAGAALCAPADPIASGAPLDIAAFEGVIRSPYVILVRRDDGAVLFERDMDAAIYPASLTKMMTALVAIDQIPDLTETVSVPEALFAPLKKANASMAGFRAGEAVRAVDVIYGVMLPSGGEASGALAVHVAGSEDAFVDLMNEKAEALGMTGTHFKNVTGLHHPDHVTTVRDMAVLMLHALRDDTFRDVITAKRHYIRPTNRHPEGLSMRSTLFDALREPDFPGGRILGGKTGFTSQAGLCLASLAEKDGTEYVLVTAGADGTLSTAPYHVKDAMAIYKSIRERG